MVTGNRPEKFDQLAKIYNISIHRANCLWDHFNTSGQTLGYYLWANTGKLKANEFDFLIVWAGNVLDYTI